MAEQAGLSARSAGFGPAIRIDGDVASELSGDDATGGRAPRALKSADLEWAHVVVSIGCDQSIAPPGDYLAVEWHLPECAAGLPQDLAPQLRRLIFELVMDLAGADARQPYPVHLASRTRSTVAGGSGRSCADERCTWIDGRDGGP